MAQSEFSKSSENLSEQSQVPEQNVQELISEPFGQAKKSTAVLVQERAEKAQAFWAEFMQEKEHLLSLNGREAVEKSCDMVAKYFSGVAIELEQDTQGQFTDMVLSAQGIIAYFNDVMLLSQHAPADLGIRLTAFRQRVSQEVADNFSINMDDLELKANDIFVQLRPVSGRIAIRIGVDLEIAPDMVEHVHHMSIIMMDHILGEYDSSVKIAEIDFAEEPLSKADKKKYVPLPEIAPALDKMWRDELGHTQVFPTREQEQWLSFEINDRDTEETAAIGQYNESARAVACRADLGVRLEVMVQVPDKETIERLYAFEDILISHIAPLQLGIHVLTLLSFEQALRTMTYYVGDGSTAAQIVTDIAQQFPDLELAYEVVYDPRWTHYLQWMPSEQDNE